MTYFTPMVCLPSSHVYVKDVVNFLCNGRVLLGSVLEFFQKVCTFHQFNMQPLLTILFTGR